ncbi:ABC transporter substrate-binding protein [Comamonas composti]|uniref:ABC transporter substrate-binding protein n=1 Tax=Comamonas composti TaxID=408558 RepID=UPI0004263B1B|nr:ABC transporter substrate-binding protein [Comamonas composti]
MKISRRSALAAAVLAAWLNQGSALAQSALQKQPDTLVYLHSIEPKSLYQWWTQAAYPKRQILDSLVYLDSQLKLHPWLARSWSQKGKVWTFELRDDVVFSDGSKLDAATVVKNVEFWKKLTTSVPDSFIEGARAVGPHTVEVHTSIAQPYLAQLLTSASFGVSSAPSLDRDLKELGERPIGSGPFVLKEWKRGEEFVFERNDAYRWGPGGTHGGPAHLKTVHWRFVPDANARWLALEKGEADVIYDPPAVKWKQAQARYATSQQFAPGRAQSLSFNVEQGIFTDQRVRQAFAYASNRQQIVSSVFRGATPYEGNGALSRTTQDYLNLDDQYPHDLNKAIALLKAAGYDQVNAQGYRVNKEGRLLQAVLPLYPTVINAEGVIAAQALQAEVKKAGFKLDTSMLTQTELAAGRYTKADEYDIYNGYWTWYAPTVLSINYRPAGDNSSTASIYGRQQINQFAADKGRPNIHNRVRSQDQKLQDAIIAAHETADPAARQARFAQIQRQISDQALAVGFYASAYNIVQQKYLQGLLHNTDAPWFYEVRK